jgi:formamidopyrimidine-DNA glycosylase
MPELPEVETHVRDLEPELRNRAVTAAQVLWRRTIAVPSAEQFVGMIAGQHFTSFGRRGKYMLFGMASGDTLIIHLRMSGKLFVRPANTAVDLHTRVVFELDDGRRLCFVDPRKFGRIWLVANAEEVVGKLGPEPQGNEFTAEWLAQKLAKRGVAVKSLLLDQSIAAGVGNIYADEALHEALIHPLRRGSSLTPDEIERLRLALAAVLTRAVELGGSSLGRSPIQNYLRPSGEAGEFQEEHRVYARTGKPCLRCTAPITRIVVGQRSTHFCPICQPLVEEMSR